jgi:cation diffusion facilitator CzcD-associated flavoprotein CzcO
MNRPPETLIIGAGSSGIPCIKALRDAGLPVDCFEAGSEVGGNWCIRNDNGMSSAYDSLHINTSRPRMAYADYPMPEDYPDFPGHRAIKRYFDDYVDHFGLRDAISFRTRVETASREPNGRWQVVTGDGQEREYDALMVASGHHWDARWPDPPYPGEFAGEVLHAHHYRNPAEPLELAGKRVLVVGLGNSAMDIACELCRPGLCEKVVISSRSPAWIIPKYLFGRPMDQVPVLPAWVPWRLRSSLLQATLSLAVGRPEKYGLPAPDHALLSSHPTVSQEILGKFGSGDLSWRPDIQNLDRHQVQFADNSSEEFDVIIYCTGYNVSFPFLDAELAPVTDNRMDLWLRMLRPAIANLFFIGLMQPLGAIMPLAEAQAKMLADHLGGVCWLPDDERMHQQTNQATKQLQRRYRASARHTMQVDFDIYLGELRTAHRTGLKHHDPSRSHSFWSRMDPRSSCQEKGIA